jgi:PAS domain S-box-containing protein
MIYRINPDKVDLQYLDLIKNIFDEFKNHFENSSFEDFLQPINDPNNIWLKHLYDIPILINVNINGTCIWTNETIQKVFGYKINDWLDQSVEDFKKKFHPIDLPGMMKILNDMELNNKFYHIEFRMKDKKGDWHWLYSLISPIIFSKQFSKGFRIIAGIDVTSKVDIEFEMSRLNTGLKPSYEIERDFLFKKEIMLEKELLERENLLKKQAKELQERDEYLLKIQNLFEQGKAIKEKNIQFFSNVKTVHQELQSKNEWLQLEQEFFKINPMFMNKLSTEYPVLTNMELRICAMIKLNMRTKEISGVLNISQKTVDNHRLNIRKKLNLDESTRLSLFLMKY